MSRIKRHESGDNPPQHLPVFMVGRFQLVHTIPGKIWITDTVNGDGGSFDMSELEAAIGNFYGQEF